MKRLMFSLFAFTCLCFWSFADAAVINYSGDEAGFVAVTTGLPTTLIDFNELTVDNIIVSQYEPPVQFLTNEGYDITAQTDAWGTAAHSGLCAELEKDFGENPFFELIFNQPVQGVSLWILDNMNVNAKAYDSGDNEIWSESFTTASTTYCAVLSDVSEIKRIRVETTNSGDGIGFDDVTIVYKPITVLAPNGGEELIASQTEIISWDAFIDINNIKIELSDNNGVDWIDVNASTTNDGSYDCTVPQVTSNQCLVRISDVNDANIYDISDNVFTIFKCLGLPGDLNKDCYVNFFDFAIVAEHWLHTGNPLDPASGIVAYWSFNDLGNPGYDDSGNGYNGTIYGGVTSIDGVSGKALDFDGLDGYASGFGEPLYTNDFSVSAWFNADSFIGTQQTIIGQFSSTNGHSRFEIAVGDSKLYIVQDRSTGAFTGTGNRSIVPGAWYHVVFLSDSQGFRAYLNGDLEIDVQNSNVLYGTSNQGMAIGARVWSTGNVVYFFDGKIDEVEIWDRTLSVSEVQSLYQNP